MAPRKSLRQLKEKRTRMRDSFEEDIAQTTALLEEEIDMERVPAQSKKSRASTSTTEKSYHIYRDHY